MIRSKVYQKKYQEALAQQLDVILTNLHEKEYETINEYLYQCYESGYAGALYSIQGQGIPLTTPINQKNVVKAVTMDSKLSKGLYKRLGQDVGVMKRTVAAEISRGIAHGLSYHNIARQINFKTSVGMKNATRIARTEGHRIQVQATEDEMREAKKHGANQVKQWEASLDSRTRDSHRKVDGEIRELDEKFSNGLMYPGDPNGPAAEVINCRCGLLPRARVMLDEDELKILKERAEFFGLDKTDSFEEFKIKHMNMDESDVGDKIYDFITGLKNQKSSFQNGIPNVADPDARTLLEQSFDRTTIKRSSNGKSHYNSSEGILYLAKGTPTSTLAHELFHEIDHTYQLIDNGLLSRSIQTDYARLQRLAKRNGTSIEDMLLSKYPEAFTKSRKGSPKLKEEYRGISDILNGMSGGAIRLGYKHPDSYWARDSRKLPREAWAQYGRMYYVG